MPRQFEHVKKAQHDERFVLSLDPQTTPYVDWMITAMFYAAMHYVEAYFASRGAHSPDHRTRDSAIRRDQALKSIYSDYSELKNFSINARYYHQPFTPLDVTQNLQKRIDHLKSHILPLL